MAADADKTADTLPLYADGKPVRPYVLQIGTLGNWGQSVPDSGRLDAGDIRIEPSSIEGADVGRKVTWNSGVGQAFLQAPLASDLKDYLDADGALVFDAVVHEPPSGQVTLRVDCNYPCMGTMEAGDLFRSLPPGQRSTVKIPLVCFARDGAKFSVVNTPFLIYATAKFSLSFADVRWVKGAAKDADARSDCK